MEDKVVKLIVLPVLLLVALILAIAAISTDEAETPEQIKSESNSEMLDRIIRDMSIDTRGQEEMEKLLERRRERIRRESEPAAPQAVPPGAPTTPFPEYRLLWYEALTEYTPPPKRRLRTITPPPPPVEHIYYPRGDSTYIPFEYRPLNGHSSEPNHR